MDSTTERRIIDDVGQLIERRTTAMADEVHFEPTSNYIDPARLAAERARIFRNFPAAVMPSAKIPNPNDFVTTTVNDLPVIVVRGKDSQVRTLVNVCRHRANRVCHEASGNRRMFACQYHAWTYDTTGQCRSFVDRSGFADVETKDFGLVELPTEERHGYVWCVPNPDASIDMAGYIGAELDAEIGTYDIGNQLLYAETEMHKPFNWKLGVDTFHEVFHLAFLHKDTVGPLFLGNVGAYEKFGLNHRFVAVRNTFPELLTKPESEQQLLPNCGLVYFLFPGTFVNWQMDHMETWSVLPDPHDDNACIIRASMFIHEEPPTESVARHWERNWTVLKESVMTEDFDTMENIQRNLQTGVLTELPFGRNEIALQNFHKDLDNELVRHGEQ